MKMKKILGGFLLLCGAQWVYAGGYITITDKPYYVDTLEHKVVGPGAVYTSLYIPDMPVYAYILKLDMQNPYNKIETFLTSLFATLHISLDIDVYSTIFLFNKTSFIVKFTPFSFKI